jgi:type III pantothenate kinase
MDLLLVIDVGNTNIVFGVYRGEKLLHSFRISTRKKSTSSEYLVIVHQLFSLFDIPVEKISGTVISSVVPPLTDVLRDTLIELTSTEPLVVGPGIKTGVPIVVDNPREVGTDRIVNTVATYTKYGGPAIVVDLGTATTFDVISGKGEYLGGAISPGIGISMNALFNETAQLPRVEMREPARVIGKNTVESMQSGIFYGYVSLIDGMIMRIKEELKEDAVTVATGGLASLLATASQCIDKVDPDLTLEGLRILYAKNRQ